MEARALEARPTGLRSPRERRELAWALAFLLPNLLAFVGFTVGPMLFSLGMTVMDWPPVSTNAV